MCLHSCCNEVPVFFSGQKTADAVYGFFRCMKCNKEGYPIEGSWNGPLLRGVAVLEWNSSFE